MRSPSLALILLVGCGSVRLGGEEPQDELDVDASSTLDGGGIALRAVVAVAVPDAGCASCLELSVTGALGTPPYTVEWEDGSKLARRTICAPVSQDTFSVVVRDATGRMSPPHEVRPDLQEATCVDASAPLLWLDNPSFEGKPLYNAGGQFDAPPWSDCTQPPRWNTPQIVNDTIRQWVTEIPDPRDGATFLGLLEGHQASQALAQPLRAGEERSFRIDARKLDISNATLDNSEKVFLEVSGGVRANCTVRELLWMSPSLGLGWQTLCVTIVAREYTDQLTLRAVSDESQVQSVFMLADNIVPVASCP
ncbi:MAG: hypothetical protein ABW352_02445 [Polyangiales bacterium]